MAKQKKETPTQPLEKVLWQTADKLRKNMDAAEYKHIVLGLIFLKYISDAFEELYTKLSQTKGADPEDPDEYRAEHVFYVPQNARWNFIHTQSKLPTIGKTIDDAMDHIESLNPNLKGVLPKVYARPNLDKAALGGLIDLISNIALGDAKAKSKDTLGQVYGGSLPWPKAKRAGSFIPRAV